MTTPNVPLRMELTFELPGTPEQVWEAVATANGISAWFIPTEIEERLGGRVAFHMGEDASVGKVTAWEPPRRVEYEEPDWARLSGHEDAAVTPLVSEFLVQAQSGGTCLLRVVSSAFGTGADWEQEFIDEMEKGWMPFFDNLRLYLVNFPGQQVTSLSVDAQIPGSADAVWDALRERLRAGKVGDPVDARGLDAKLERISEPPLPYELLLRVDDPVPGYLEIGVFDLRDGVALVRIEGYLFSPDARAYVDRERPAWKEWLNALSPRTGVTHGG